MTNTPTITPTPYNAPNTIFGVQAFESEIQAAVLNGSAEAGTRYVRLRIMWKYVEPADTSPPTYNWSGVDQAASTLAAHGLRMVANIYGNPSWAASTECGPVDIAPLSRYGDFVHALVERLDADGSGDASGSPRVAYWEVSNEPDFDLAHAGGEVDPGGCFGGRSEAYADHLREFYQEARSADSGATILFGGVAYDRFYNKSGYQGPSGPFDYTFVRGVLDHLYAHHRGESGWPFFDWMSLHVYNDYRNEWDGASQPYEQELLGKIKHLRNNQMLHVGQYDLRSKPLAITEASVASMPSDSYTTRSESIQSAYPGQLLVRSMSAGVRQLIWFSVEDHRTGDCSNPYDWLGLGILRSLAVYQSAAQCTPNPIPDYEVSSPHERKPAHTAYKTAVGQLAGGVFDRQLTPAETGSTQIEAYRFARADGVRAIVAFTDNGERLGRIGYPPVELDMVFDASILPGWTGSLAIVDHVGNTTIESGSAVTVTLTQWPVYVRPN